MEFPKAVLEGDPYPIKALIIDGGSIFTSYPDPPRWEKALRALDFLVVIDRFMTNEAELADIVLPATTYYEITSYKLYPNYLQLRQRVIDPVGESRNDYLIYRELADRLGCEEYPPTEEALVDHILKPSGYTVEELKKHPEGILPGVVEVNVGGGGRNHLPGWKEANANLLTDPDNRDPISGFPVLKALLCEVRHLSTGE